MAGCQILMLQVGIEPETLTKNGTTAYFAQLLNLE